MRLTAPLLQVEHLAVSYTTPSGVLRAVRDVSFRIQSGETLALVGETGSGKTTVALAAAGLLDYGNQLESGQITFEGRQLDRPGGAGWQELRSRKIGMVFQDARSSLNPVLTIGDHLLETIRSHQDLNRKRARACATELLAEVGIPDPEYNMRRYPFELSGGMCQRVGIALGICNRPRLLIADEPTSALDPTIQAQILDLLVELKQRHGLALLLVSHDLALVSEFADRVAVMYCGRLVECGPAREIFVHPSHPYTRGLLESLPGLHQSRESPLRIIPGMPPAAGEELPGCAFAPRCPLAEQRCTAAIPAEVTISGDHWAACLKAGL